MAKLKNKRDYSPYVITLDEENREVSNKLFLNKMDSVAKNIPTATNAIDKPNPKTLSQSEPKYEPNVWNDREQIKYNHNCYAYLLDTIASKRNGKPQPGYFSNFPPLQNADYNCESFYRRLKKDIPSMYLTDINKKCRKNFYKGFLALDPKEEDTDYHFYRQDSSGYWSHKPGRQDAIDYDANNKKIIDPLRANRRYKYFDYSKPCFYFCLDKNLARSKSSANMGGRKKSKKSGKSKKSKLKSKTKKISSSKKLSKKA